MDGTEDYTSLEAGWMRFSPIAEWRTLAEKFPTEDWPVLNDAAGAVRDDVPSLRTVKLVRELERSFGDACDRGDFRLVHYSLQGGRQLARAVRLDPASSGRWFDGWRSRPAESRAPPPVPKPVASPRSWLLCAGWRRRGLLDPDEVPGSPSG